MPMTFEPRLDARTAPLLALLCCVQGLLPTAASADEKISVDALPMRPVISNPSPERNWFQARFGLTWDELAANYSVEEVDQFLQRWRSTYPDDPEAWISSANWNRQQSQQSMLHSSTAELGVFVTEPGPEGSVGLRRPDDQESGFISGGIHTDEPRLSAALRLFQEAQERFPYRVDVYDNLANFYFTLGRYEKQLDTLRTMTQAIRETDRDLEWINYQTLRVSKEEVLFNSFHYAANDLYQVDSEAALDANLELALLMTQTLPNNSIAWNNLVVAHERLGNKMGAYQAAQKAYEIDPNDEIIVINLAKYCIELGFNEEAIRHYRWIIRNSDNPEFRETARADLELLGAPLE